jgi:alkaline phosphatase
MTDKAIQVLSQNPNGFVLMIEGASIDKQAHNMDTERWILDTVEFDNAAEKVRQFAINPANGETLAIITADHECAGAAIIGGSLVTQAQLATRAASGLGTAAGGPRNGVVGTYEAAGFPSYTLAVDGYPVTMDIDYRMLIGYAANADRYEDWIMHELPLRDGQQPTASTPYGAIVGLLPNLPTNRDTAGNYLVTGQIQDTTAAHTAGDIPLSAIGRGASAFTGYQDNTDVFFKAMQAAIGGAK